MVDSGSAQPAQPTVRQRPAGAGHGSEDTRVPSGAPRTQDELLRPGLVFQQYELIRELGRGAMGRVFLARDRKLARKIAIKFLASSADPDMRVLLAEARATARCSHENIVVLHDVGEHAGRPFIVLEYLRGRPLSELLVEGRRFRPRRAVALMIPVVKALIRAHEFGIVHRDLKPENIFVCDSGTIKVVDFGIAKLLAGMAVPGDSGASGDTGDEPPPTSPRSFSMELEALGVDAGIFGTPAYMAPEQWNREPVDHRTDLWAAGLVLFELVCGIHPLAPRSDEKLRALVTDPEQPLPTVRELRDDVPSELERIIARCVAKRPEDRFGSAVELLEALRAFQPSRDSQHLVALGDCPYPGLAPFAEQNAALFFGRTREVSAVANLLETRPLMAILGPSGAGKSSFVRAGLAPALKQSGEPWELITVRPGREPLAALARVVRQSQPEDDSGSPGARRGLLMRSLREEPGSFGTHLRALAKRNRGSVMLFVDQLEELYTLGTPVEDRRAFVACLMGASDDASAPVRVVVAMRSDYLDRTGEDRVFQEDLSRGMYLLRPPDSGSMREILMAPAELAGYRFEDDALVEEMLEGLEDTPGALPVLQFTASQLWAHRNRDRKLLTRASYGDMGGIEGALASHADAVIQSMPSTSRAVAREVLLRLITVESTRAIAEVDDLLVLGGTPATTQRVIDDLAEARLLVVQSREEEEGATVELVHESLIHHWPTLRRWIEERQEHAVFLEQLRSTAKQWAVAGRPEGLLWRGESMEEARRFSRRYDGELSSLESRYLQAVLTLATRSARIRRTVVAGVILGLLAILGVGVVALLQIRSAERKALHQAQTIRVKEKRARAAEREARQQYQQLVSEQKAKKQAVRVANQAKATVRTQAVKLTSAEKELQKSNVELKRALKRALEQQRQAEAARKKASASQVKSERTAAEMKRLAERERLAKVRYQKLLAKEKARARVREKRLKQIEHNLR